MKKQNGVDFLSSRGGLCRSSAGMRHGRLALLMAAGLLMAAPAQAGCVLAGGIETCTGNLSGGLNFGSPPVNELDVQDLAVAHISPSGGVIGIALTGGGGTASGGGTGASS